MTKAYLVYYDSNDMCSREEWNVFYTPCEVFLDKSLADKRVKFLKTKLPNNYSIEEVTVEISTNHNQILAI